MNSYGNRAPFARQTPHGLPPLLEAAFWGSLCAMKVDRFLRALLAVVIAVLFLVAIAAALFVTESALNVWDRLRQGPAWLLYGYVTLMVLLVLSCLWLIWRYVIPRRRSLADAAKVKTPVSEETLQERLESAQVAGVDTYDARQELQRLSERKAGGKVHLAMFGEISRGKSSLIRALLPSARVEVSAVGGSTREIREYHWDGPNGATLSLTDVPGISGPDALFDKMAKEEALRAHVVLFICDGDLSRQETKALAELLQLEKPVILVLNKADRYDDKDLDRLLPRLGERAANLRGGSSVLVVPVSAGGEQEITVVQGGEAESQDTRAREPNVAQLMLALNEVLRGNFGALEQSRDRSVFRLAAEKLDAAETEYRARRAEEIVRASTRKAIIGALAAISPGTDIVIQGYLATALTRELCALYGISARDLDVEQFLDLSQSRAGRALPLTLAVAGNGLKAFPGIGTVAGGLVHAVAYGLLFDALGRSLAQSLAEGETFTPQQAAADFEENLGEHLEAGVRRVAQIALTEQARKRERER